MAVRSFVRSVAGVVLCAGLFGCAQLESIYQPVETVALTGPTRPGDRSCDKPVDPAAPPPAYSLGHLRDCTAPDSIVVFAFSGGGIRSAAFGYGVLQAAHATIVPDPSGSPRTLDSDIDIVSGVSGGSFTAAAFATHREALFPVPGGPDYYRDKFLTHDFFADLTTI